MYAEEKRSSSQSIYYYTLLGIGELFGFISVILVGIIFNKELVANGYDWTKSPFNYHPLFMTLGLLFCYGNAIVLYRTFKGTSKLLVKIFHATLLIVSLIFASVGFAAIVRSKNVGKRPHFMTYHSWIGLTTLILFTLQWVCGFVSFLFPKTSLDMRQRYMPSHRLWGKIIFLSAVVAILTGLSENGMATSFFTVNDIERPRRLLMDFFGLFTSLFSLIIIYLLSNSNYQRPPDQ